MTKNEELEEKGQEMEYDRSSPSFDLAG